MKRQSPGPSKGEMWAGAPNRSLCRDFFRWLGNRFSDALQHQNTPLGAKRHHQYAIRIIKSFFDNQIHEPIWREGEGPLLGIKDAGANQYFGSSFALRTAGGIVVYARIYNQQLLLFRFGLMTWSSALSTGRFDCGTISQLPVDRITWDKRGMRTGGAEAVL
jgi:hypothetical protein